MATSQQIKSSPSSKDKTPSKGKGPPTKGSQYWYNLFQNPFQLEPGWYANLDSGRRIKKVDGKVFLDWPRIAWLPGREMQALQFFIINQIYPEDKRIKFPAQFVGLRQKLLDLWHGRKPERIDYSHIDQVPAEVRRKLRPFVFTNDTVPALVERVVDGDTIIVSTIIDFDRLARPVIVTENRKVREGQICISCQPDPKPESKPKLDGDTTHHSERSVVADCQASLSLGGMMVSTSLPRTAESKGLGSIPGSRRFTADKVESFNGLLIQLVVRLFGVDTGDEDKNEKNEARKKLLKDRKEAGTDYTQKWCKRNKDKIWLQLLGHGKYGRVLGVVYPRAEGESQVSITKKDLGRCLMVYKHPTLGSIAEPYHGGSKDEAWGEE